MQRAPAGRLQGLAVLILNRTSAGSAHRHEDAARHFGRDRLAHEREHGRGDVGEDAVFNTLDAVGDDEDGDRVERVGRVGRAVGVDGVVGVAVVGDLDDFVAVVARGVDDGACAGVDGDDGLFNRVVDAVWPTMSPLAKLRQMKSYCSVAMASTSFSVTSGALIWGCRS